jgi:feruloyl esterase
MFCATDHAIATGLAATLVGAAAMLVAAPVRSAPVADGCAALAMTRADLTVTAESVPAGTTVPGGLGGAASAPLPAFCRVTGQIRPVPGSTIGFQLWLPATGQWTGRLQMLGNGGYSSQLPLGSMAEALARGSAVTATDTGHQGDDPDFAIGRPQAIVDWGQRAVHRSAQTAKALAARFYGRAPRRSYFNGCSTGGHQAMMEAQRFPADFDGIVAGAPGSNRVRLNAAFLWQFRANHPAGSAAAILTRDDAALLARHALAVCAPRNGGVSGGLAGDAWLNDPLACRPDSAALTCRPGQIDDCLTPAKVDAVRLMYRGAVDPRSGRAVTFPWLPGSEAGWPAYWADPQHADQPARANFWRVWVGGGADWSPDHFDFGRDLDRAVATLGPIIDATSPDLTRFRARGGRLIQYHGLADPVVSPLDTIAYRRAVQVRMGDPDGWYRLFLVPGMGHCGGGPGLTRFDAQAAIEAWVEQGRAPDRLVATRGGASRPLCPYPARAVHVGGQDDAADSFACRVPSGARS